MDKIVDSLIKEIVISCAQLIHQPYLIVCDEHELTEYMITIVGDRAGDFAVNVWVKNASKKITVTYEMNVEKSTIESTIFIKAIHNNQHALRVFQNHHAADTSSQCTIKGIAYDTSGIDYQGLITLPPESCNTHAYQKSTFLIMSDAATVRSVPSLQVHHNQVQCGHATTISYLDPIVIWYSAQRGLETKKVEEMIEEVFLGDDFL